MNTADGVLLELASGLTVQMTVNQAATVTVFLHVILIAGT